MPDNILSLILRARDEATANVTKVAKSFDALGTSAKNAHGSASGLSSVLSGIGAGVGIAGVMGVANATSILANGLEGAVKAASDLAEQQAKSNVVFGQSAGIVSAFARTSAESYAISARAALQATGTLGNMFTAMGIGQQKAASMSIEMVKLAGDLASFNNIPVDVALEKLRAGLAGEIEPLRTLGVNLSDVALRAQAMAMGLQVSAAPLDAQTKTLAAYELILKQTATAQGDFQRTSDSLANQQRALAAEVENLGAKLGAAIVPALAEVTRTVTNAVEVLDSLEVSVGENEEAFSAFDAVGQAFNTTVGMMSGGLGPLIAIMNANAEANDNVRESLDGAAVSAKYAAINLLDQGSAAVVAGGKILTKAEADKAAAAAAWIAAANSATAINAFVNQGRAALWAAEKIDILSDASAGADMTARIAASGAWSATTAYYAQAAGLERAGMGLSRVSDKVKDYATATDKATRSTGSLTSSAGALASRLQTQVVDAFQRFKTAALDALDRAHEKTLRLIDDQQRLADAAYEAARAAIQGPVDAARAELEAARAAQQLADAQNELNEAYASGDAQRIAAAQRRLDEIVAQQAIDAMQREADAQIAALAETKAAEDQARADAREAENLSYEQKKAAMEADLKLIEDQLTELDKKYKGRTTDLINALKEYKVDFTKLGKSLGVSYADGVVEGLDTLIPKIAKKVAEILGTTVPQMPAVPVAAPATPGGLTSAAVPGSVPMTSAAPGAGVPTVPGGTAAPTTYRPTTPTTSVTQAAPAVTFNFTLQTTAFVGTKADARRFSQEMWASFDEETDRRSHTWPDKQTWDKVVKATGV